MDYIRQLELFDPDTFNTPVHIIGAGATGSWVALFLAKLGVKDITVYDFDRVEEHNLPNQAFRRSFIIEPDGPVEKTPEGTDIGEYKVNALTHVVYDFAGMYLKPKRRRVTGETRLEGVVFLLTDTMSSRKEIWEGALKFKPTVKLVIETRMGLSDGRIYTINPLSTSDIAEYEKTFYTDEEAEVSACGASQSVVTTATSIASMAVRQLVNWYNQVDINQEMLIDFEYNQIFTRRFE